MAVNNELIKDDLYEAVNGDWIKTAKIPDDKPATGGFNDLVDQIDKQLMDDLDKFADGKEKVTIRVSMKWSSYTRSLRSLTSGRKWVPVR